MQQFTSESILIYRPTRFWNKSDNLILDTGAGSNVESVSFCKDISSLNTLNHFFQRSVQLFTDNLLTRLLSENSYRRRRIVPEHRGDYDRPRFDSLVTKNQPSVSEATCLIQKHKTSRHLCRPAAGCPDLLRSDCDTRWDCRDLRQQQQPQQQEDISSRRRSNQQQRRVESHVSRTVRDLKLHPIIIFVIDYCAGYFHD